MKKINNELAQQLHYDNCVDKPAWDQGVATVFHVKSFLA